MLADESLAKAYYANWVRSQGGDLLDGGVHAPPAAYSKRRRALAWCFLVLAIGAIAVAVVLGSQTRDDEAAPRDRASEPATQNDVVADPPPKTPAQRLDEAAAAEGWQVVESGELYIKAAEPDTFTCGSYPCLWYTVQSTSGCESGVYVKADIMHDGHAVAWTNAITPSISGGEAVSVMLEDVQGVGSQFRLSEVSCMDF
ncbi:hypothetical protein ACFVR6_11445 [Microbacterium sp. NPDC058021]|uniref:hypothetical protein n=1 Tax=Microbacterium sp. NPDC058021 TaxID=3346306 RepID=UPI0036DBE808